VNINDHVWVRLTPIGRAIHVKDHRELQLAYPNNDIPYTPPKEINGWSRFQLWSLMRQFGPFCYLGADLPFETEIRFTDPNAPE